MPSAILTSSTSRFTLRNIAGATPGKSDLCAVRRAVVTALRGPAREAALTLVAGGSPKREDAAMSRLLAVRDSATDKRATTAIRAAIHLSMARSPEIYDGQAFTVEQVQEASAKNLAVALRYAARAY